MWRLSRATLRERTNSNHRRIGAFRTPLSTTKRFKNALSLQLDYYLSPQFAGVASALVNNTYSSKGVDISFLPICPVGFEQANVRKHQDANPSSVTLGTVEQNIFIPNLATNPQLKTTAVAAMFGQSPLCLASLEDPSKVDDLKIGTHKDTVEVMKRIFPSYNVVASPRATKNTDLLNGEFGAIQAYTTTEVPALRRQLGKEPYVTPLEGLNGTKLGYSQVIFAADECLQDGGQREIIKAFCEATFEGYADAVRNPEEAARMVAEAKKLLNLDDEGNDHWYPSIDFDVEMLAKCNDFVKMTFHGDRYGVINSERWSDANRWLLKGEKVTPNFGFDPDLWQPPTNLLSGNAIAQKTMENAKASATFFEQTYGRKPSLAVLTVGDLKRYEHSNRRFQIYSNSASSWFSKSSTGNANGFDVMEINLDASTTTDDLLSQIYHLRDADGIQLMWPLPDHIDTARVYSAIDVAKDVDGIHYVGQVEIGNKGAYPPVTPAAAITLIEEYKIDIEGKRVLVIGRSPIIGSPIAHMVREKGGLVTVAHSQAGKENLKKLVGEAQVVICCAGLPGLVQAEWLNGAEVLNVGTTFDPSIDSLVSDVQGDIGKYASRYSPVPGGIGPISAPMLFKNVAKAAWDRMSSTGAVHDNGWEEKPASLKKMFHFSSYTSAIEACQKVDRLSTVMDHHANMKLTHHCVDGVDLEMEFFTFEAKKITEKDFGAANAIDMVLSEDKVEMSKYSYNLAESSIAKYPANPRGSSKLLKIDSSSNVTYYDNFSDAFAKLSKGAHLVFNDSRVLDARLFLAVNGAEVELMILDLGSIDVGDSCKSTHLHAMIRLPDVNVGDIFEESNGHGRIEVVGVKGIWEEDEKSDGNGIECFVKIASDKSVENFLEMAGSVPIPPYLHRKDEEKDKEAYNNTYAANAGSVAAPTAGLHFTEEVLDEIGSENCSYLSLHVGAGTFKPVMVKDARDHAMHAETFAVPVKELKNIIVALKAQKPLIVVGTTSSRTLESLFWCGVKRIRGLDKNIDELSLDQFEWVPLSVGEGRNVSRIAAFEALIEGLGDDEVISGRTSLMIAPPYYEFHVVDHLVTNFHAPDSTLMLLVSAFLKDSSGAKISSIYENAQDNGYRFLSFGDACMFSRPGLN